MKIRFRLLTLFMLLFPALALSETHTLRILHINDFHGFAHPVNAPGMARPLGGAALLAARIVELRTGRPTLLLVAGDSIQGDSWVNLNEGAAAVELMNMIGPDAMVTGNHEFDYGLEVLRRRTAEAKFPILAANVAGMNELKPYVIIQRGGLRIGVIGLVTEDTPETSHPRNTSGLKFSRAQDRAVELIRELRPKTDLIVLLTHLGHTADRALAEALNSTSSTDPPGSISPGEVVIVGGHSHTRVERPVQIGSSCIVQAWEYGKTLGVLDITLRDGRLAGCEGRLEEITPGPEDARVAALVREFDQRGEALLAREAGRSDVDLLQEGVRRRETNLGNMVADVVRETAGAEAAIINGGSIRTGIRRGSVRMRDIYAALPFNNYIVAVRMSGRQVRETLEHGVSGIEAGEGRFAQVSGLSFEFDPARPVGSRVGRILAGGKPLDETRIYTVATLDFMAAGGDGYKAFGSAIRSAGDFSEIGGTLHSSSLVYNDPGRWLRDLVADYLRNKGAIAPQTEGRIREPAR